MLGFLYNHWAPGAGALEKLITIQTLVKTVPAAVDYCYQGFHALFS